MTPLTLTIASGSLEIRVDWPARHAAAAATIEFLQPDRLPEDLPVRLCLEDGPRGVVHELTGVPEHVGSAIRPGGVIEYRYRLAGPLQRRGRAGNGRA